MKSKILPLIITLFIVAVIYFVSQSIDPSEIRRLVENAGIFGPFIVVLLTIVAAVFAPLSSTPISFVGFILYGPSVVILLTISMILSSIINFLIARKWGRPLITKFVGEDNITSIDKFTSSYGILGLFLMRVFLGGFHDFISYAMGLTNMKFTQYFITTLLGIIPGTLMFYLIAIRSETPVVFLLASYLFATVFIGVYLIVRFVISLSKTANINR